MSYPRPIDSINVYLPFFSRLHFDYYLLKIRDQNGSFSKSNEPIELDAMSKCASSAQTLGMIHSLDYRRKSTLKSQAMVLL